MERRSTYSSKGASRPQRSWSGRRFHSWEPSTTTPNRSRSPLLRLKLQRFSRARTRSTADPASCSLWRQPRPNKPLRRKTRTQRWAGNEEEWLMFELIHLSNLRTCSTHLTTFVFLIWSNALATKVSWGSVVKPINFLMCLNTCVNIMNMCVIYVSSKKYKNKNKTCV